MSRLLVRVGAAIRDLVATAACFALCATAAAGTDTYQYDELGRLTTVIYANGTRVIFALDAAGNRTALTTTLNADVTPPTAPSSLAAIAASATQIDLSWGASTDNVAVTGYRVERCQGAGCSTFAEVAAPVAPNYSDTGLAAATAYSYRVRASDAAGNLGPYSNTASATTLAAPPGGTLQLAASSYSVAENAGSLTVTVTRAGGSVGAASINYATSNGTAISGGDYTASSGTLNWSSGDSTSKTFAVSITNDAATEGNETFTVTLSGPGGGAALGTPAAATVTITDDEAPAAGMLALNPSSYAVSEGQGSVVVTVTRSGGTSQAVSVGYATSDGTALAGSDYMSTAGTLNWANGDGASKIFSVPIVDDASAEAAETLTVTLANPAGGATLGVASGTITINDNESGTVQFVAPPSSVGESAGSVSFTVSRTNGSSGSASVLCQAVSGLATAGVDFTNPNTTLSWTNGESSSKSCVVPILSDAIGEQNEDFAVQLANPSGVTLGTPSSQSVSILDDDDSTPPTAPSGLVASSTASGLANLSWTAGTDSGSGVAEYEVQRCTGSGCSSFAAIGTSGSTSYSDTTTSGTTTYGYRVRARDGAGNWSGYSGTATVTTPDTIAPSVPTNLAANVVSHSEVALSWSASSDTGGSGLAKYRVDRCNGAGCDSGWAFLSFPTTTSYADTAAASSNTYGYRVQAVDNADNASAYTATVYATTPAGPPGAPNLSTNHTMVQEFSNYQISWTAPTGATEYRLYRQRNGLGYSLNYQGPNLSKIFSDIRGDYEYYVQACNGYGCSGNSNPVTVTVCPGQCE